MGWAVGWDDRWRRFVGYGVPAWCDHPGCGEKVDRGLGHVCGGEPHGGEDGCGLFFCPEHLRAGLCSACNRGERAFDPKPEHPEWLEHQRTDPSWEKWREEQGK